MTPASAVSKSAPVPPRRMSDAARRFLATLDPSRLAAAKFAFADNDRYQWNYRPDGFFWGGSTVWHGGLRLVNMTAEQQQAALALLDTGLSPFGVARARAIMALEHHLRETERVVAGWFPHVVRD